MHECYGSADDAEVIPPALQRGGSASARTAVYECCGYADDTEVIPPADHTDDTEVVPPALQTGRVRLRADRSA